ncbi:MAG: hypothetical protein Kow0098_07670 [Ignavibacteriaceae bacterium]
MRKLFSVLTVVVLLSSFGFAQGKFGVSVQGGAALPMGTFGDVYSTGFGGMASLLYSVAPNVDLSGSVGYVTWSGKDNFDGNSFSSVPVLLGARVMFGGGTFEPYVCGELGMHFGSSEFEFTNPITNTTETISNSDSNFGFAAGVGALIPVSPTVNIDVNAKFNSISSEGDATNFIGIFGGVNFGFN